MKKSLLFLLLAFPAMVSGQSRTGAVQMYLERYFPNCPGARVELEEVRAANGPRGFVPYRVRLTSSSKTCGKETFALVSPASKHILVSDVFSIPTDPRRIEVRIGEVVERILKKPVRVKVAATPIEDGLREVVMTRESKEGPFDLRGYLDASQTFLIVGRRGRMDVDPRKSLLDALASTAGVRRGKADAAIRIVELSDFQCPTCKSAHDMLNDLIEKNLNRISYTRIDLPIFEGHDWSLSAAVAARAINRLAPQHYWKYVDYVFANQEVIKKESIDQFVEDFVESHDIDLKRFQAIYRSAAERHAVIDQVERVFDLGIFATPTYLLNGQEIFYGEKGANLKQTLEAALKKK